MGHALWISATILCFYSSRVQAFAKPIWNYAHMVNAVAQVEEFMELGANAIEADVTFKKGSGRAEHTYHGWPCDCFRNCRRWEYLDTYLQYIEQVASGSGKYADKLVLLGLDLKLGSLNDNQKPGAMVDLAGRLLKHLWKNGQSPIKLRVLLHLPSLKDIDHVKPFLDYFKSQGFSNLGDRVGFEVYSSDSMDVIGARWAKLNMTVNIWQSDGITNCLPRGTGRLVEAIRVRNLRSSWIKKVFWWTVDKWGSIRSTLRLGVDGVMTNHPDRVASIIQEDEFKDNFRLATHSDDPFQKIDSAMYYGWDQDIPDVIVNVDPDEESIYSYH